jgi:hypothetical protein
VPDARERVLGPERVGRGRLVSTGDLVAGVGSSRPHHAAAATWFPGIGVGDSVAPSISADPYTSDAPGWRPDNYLHVRMNSFTGYGGLIWHVMGERARATGAEDDQWCWASDNPTPPSFDPLVLSDPGGPLSFDPRSTLPAAQIRAAMEEFSRTATGERPTCVRWVHGQMSGERHDQEQERHHGNVTSPCGRRCCGAGQVAGARCDAGVADAAGVQCGGVIDRAGGDRVL